MRNSPNSQITPLHIKGYDLWVDKKPDLIAVENNSHSRYDKILHICLTYPDNTQSLHIVRPCLQCKRLLPLINFAKGASPCDQCRNFRAKARRKKHAI